MVTLVPPGYHQNWVTLVPLWDSPGAVDTGSTGPQQELVNLPLLRPRLVLVTLFPPSIFGTWLLCSPPGPHMDMITLLQLWP